MATFLQDHGHEVYPEVRAAYVDTMSKVNIILYTLPTLGILAVSWYMLRP